MLLTVLSKRDNCQLLALIAVAGLALREFRLFGDCEWLVLSLRQRGVFWYGLCSRLYQHDFTDSRLLDPDTVVPS